MRRHGHTMRTFLSATISPVVLFLAMYTCVGGASAAHTHAHARLAAARACLPVGALPNLLQLLKLVHAASTAPGRGGGRPSGSRHPAAWWCGAAVAGGASRLLISWGGRLAHCGRHAGVRWEGRRMRHARGRRGCGWAMTSPTGRGEAGIDTRDIRQE